jgi:hypothetical protein
LVASRSPAASKPARAALSSCTTWAFRPPRAFVDGAGEKSYAVVDLVCRDRAVAEDHAGEDLGVRVRRTDATRAFIGLQARRGRRAELLNVITDELGGPYDGVLVMCVLIHVGFDQTDAVLRKIAGSLRRGGGFLVSIREGDGETHGDYHTVYWRTADLTARLQSAGLRVDWDAHHVDSDGDAWLTYLTTRIR